MISITVNRSETKQMKQYEPLKIEASVMVEANENELETKLAELNEKLRLAIKAQFEKEGLR